MKLLLVGYGKMGRLVEQLAQEQGLTVAGRVDMWTAAAGRRPTSPIDFSTADALQANFHDTSSSSCRW